MNEKQAVRSRSWLPGASALVFCVGALAGCSWGDDREEWDAYLGDPQPVGLRGSIALRDDELSRLLFLTSDGPGELETSVFPMGENVTAMRASEDLSRLFVLSSGTHPRLDKDDEGPQLVVYDGGLRPEVTDSFELDDPMTRLALDPQGQWVAAYAGDATVTNPNELVLLELGAQGKEPVSKTIRSFGGAPEELLFTDELGVPQGGARRFMIVRTDRDITLVDLRDLSADEVTVRLPETDSGTPYAPAQVVYDDGEPDDDTDARIAVRLQGSSDVVIVQLGPTEEEDRDYSIALNIVDVGGVPSTLDFVRTDGGLRLSALVPSKLHAALINPETTLVETIGLPGRFSNMTRITNEVEDQPSDGDVALLWGDNSQIAFWSLGTTTSTPFRSVDANDLNVAVSDVLDVPAPNQHLKILVGYGGSGFYVLDLNKRQSFPLDTVGSGFSVRPSSDGLRLWVYRQGFNEFSSVTLNDLHPSALYVEPWLSDVFDIERADGGRAAVALHTGGTWSATILDAGAPDSSETRYFPAIFWEEMQ